MKAIKFHKKMFIHISIIIIQINISITYNNTKFIYLRYNDIHLTSELAKCHDELLWVTMNTNPASIDKNLCCTENRQNEYVIINVSNFSLITY